MHRRAGQLPLEWLGKATLANNPGLFRLQWELPTLNHSGPLPGVPPVIHLLLPVAEQVPTDLLYLPGNGLPNNNSSLHWGIACHGLW